ncbi:AlpA family phage regulatory protein [Brevundimonas sp.]|uniref:helix-turn-helix transcriptional regulator n=1 Tax=Brevundimonas sp. TaxID=1871086 RepID=UPI0019B4DD64|nr:AlpA family phage regulatory protein [Brevundimonas sp.]MBD3835368.1 AlpA family phage regulatory protein [Brevundimonas sp.]
MAHDDGLERFLGWRQVRDLTGLGRTTAWRMRQAGDFPEPVPISPGRVAWRERDIAAWSESRGAPLFPRAKPAASSRPPPTTGVRTIAPPPVPAAAVPRDAPPSSRRRGRRAIAEGQLGFDF